MDNPNKQIIDKGLKNVSYIWQVVKRYFDVYARMSSAVQHVGRESFRNNLGDGISPYTYIYIYYTVRVQYTRPAWSYL